MASKQVLLYGSSFEWGTDGIAYTDIPEAKALLVPAVTPEYVEVTNLDSTGGYREYIPGLLDVEEADILVGYTPAGYLAALGYSAARTLLYIRTTLTAAPGYSTGDVFIFRSYVVPSVNADDLGAAIDFNLNMRVSGAPIHTPATPTP